MKPIRFWETDVGLADYHNQKKIFLSNFPNEGKYVTILEEKIKKFLNVKYCLALPNGTSALYISCKILNLNSKDEVLVPNITFPATANAVYMSGAKVVLVDVNTETLNMDTKDLIKKINKNTKAIMPVHVSGRSCDMKKIMTLAKKYNLRVIEDAAEAFLSKKNGEFLGTIGDIGCYSLSPNKIITSGQGGFLVTNNKKYYEKIKVFKTQGRYGVTSGGDDLHISPGGNFKISNSSAGLALSQLRKISLRKKNLIKNHITYRNKLRDVKEINILKFDTSKGELPLWTDIKCKKRDELYDYLKKNKIYCRKFWIPLSKKNFYSNQKHFSFKNTRLIEKQIMWLPSSFLMTTKDQLRIINKIKSFYNSE